MRANASVGRWAGSFLGGLLIFLVAGCALTYREPGVEELQQSDKVILYRDHPLTEGGVCSANIDGKELAQNETRMELKPGKHRIGYGCSWPEMFKSTHLLVEMNLVAGHKYKLDVKVCGFNKCNPPKELQVPALTWIEDLTTGKIIHVEPPQLLYY